jgi:hypothetical protein
MRMNTSEPMSTATGMPRAVLSVYRPGATFTAKNGARNARQRCALLEAKTGKLIASHAKSIVYSLISRPSPSMNLWKNHGGAINGIGPNGGQSFAGLVEREGGGGGF